MADNSFDGETARRYDERAADISDAAVVDPPVSLLAELAGEGAALELGIGTGRIALPLSQQGVEVHGVDLSADMIEQLRPKPGAGKIGLSVADMTTVKLDRRFRLVYLVYNGIMCLTTQDSQVECFINAADHLEDDGLFLLEVQVPDLRRLPPGESVKAFHISPTHLGFDTYEFGSQMLISHHYWIEADGRMESGSGPYRYVWPAELDLMARIAGLKLIHRWSDWNREPFTDDSVSHVSVWQKAR